MALFAGHANAQVPALDNMGKPFRGELATQGDTSSSGRMFRLRRSRGEIQARIN